jgi:magnesium-protoporphyrin O-methyltransferase
MAASEVHGAHVSLIGVAPGIMRFVPGCCRSGVCEEMFKPRKARGTLRRYRKKGLDNLEREMVSIASAQPLTGARILEIGGGIGTIQAELLAAGARSGEVLELVSAYEPYARELAREKGIEDRSAFRIADILEYPEAVAPADIVVLNRVVCCSPEGVRLTAVAAKLAGRMLLVIYPRDRSVVRVGMRFINGMFSMMGRSFRVFLHAPSSLSAAARAEGLSVAGTSRTFAWELTAFRRSA